MTTDEVLPIDLIEEPTASEAEPLDPKRTDINAKQAIIGQILADLGCEAVLLLMPAHVAWLTGGMLPHGLIADGERPGIYTTGRQRWLICSNVDSQRLFDEELHGLGFLLKEWHWPIGRATLLGDLVQGKKVASDRPFPNMPLINERLRQHLRPMFPTDRAKYLELGKLVSHALEATARTLKPGDTEEQIAGQLAHRIFHHGAEIAGMSITADSRAKKYRRSGFTSTPIERICTLQVTAMREGRYLTASRSVCFGMPTLEERADFDAAVRVAAVYRSWSVTDAGITLAVETAANLVRNTPHEHEWRLSQPGYGTGWFAAEELRKAGVDEKFVLGQALVWQARIHAMAIVDTVLVGENGAVAVTAPQNWPYKRVRLNEQDHDIADILVRAM